MLSARSHFSVSTIAAIAVAVISMGTAQAQAPLTYHFDSGTSLTSFNGSTKAGQYLEFEVIPTAGAGSATFTASNLAYAGNWKITTADLFSATYSSDVSIGYNSSDPKSSTVTIPNSGTVSFFELPVDTFGSSFSFDLTETGAAAGSPTDFLLFANDDLVQLADVQFTPGSNQATLVQSAPGSSIVGTNDTPSPTATPEPSQNAALGVGLLGIGLLALRARRRKSA